MKAFDIVKTKQTWMGWVILCQEPDDTWSTWHTDTYDCRTGRYWGQSFKDFDSAYEDYMNRNF
jgi:hypothetical protein